MISRCLAAIFIAAIAMPAHATGPNKPEFYLNPELNTSYTKSGSLSILETHFGLKSGPWYMQCGPAINSNDGDRDVGFTGKAGFATDISDDLNVYTEVGIINFSPQPSEYNVKLGAVIDF